MVGDFVAVQTFLLTLELDAIAEQGIWNSVQSLMIVNLEYESSQARLKEVKEEKAWQEAFVISSFLDVHNLILPAAPQNALWQCLGTLKVGQYRGQVHSAGRNQFTCVGIEGLK